MPKDKRKQQDKMEKNKQKRDVNSLFETGDELTQGGYQKQYGAAQDQQQKRQKQEGPEGQ